MLQVVQNIKDGVTEVLQVPAPASKRKHALIESSLSLISSGTEKSLVEFGKSGLIGKAVGQPEKVKMVVEKVRSDGVAATYSAVKTKLDEPMQLGYCNVGRILQGSDCGLSVGSRVVSNGKHAGVVCVPRNLVAPIPDNVSDDEAAFTVLGAIGLQGIRLIAPTLGETVVVTGLGLIGLIAVQLLVANGCRVIGIDYDAQKCELARSFGAQAVNLSESTDPVAYTLKVTNGIGVDAVLIAASSRSNEVVHQAATMCRKRGRIVLVGVVGLELQRNDFYEKELTFQVSCSYGPGRYDEQYESQGNDYPLGFVRWTEKRNFEAILGLMSSGKLDVKPLISFRFPVIKAAEAYSKLDVPNTLGIVLEYQSSSAQKIEDQITSVCLKPVVSAGESGGKGENVSFLGCGNYASRVLIPSFAKAKANFRTVVTSTGTSGVHYGKKYGFSRASTDYNDAIQQDTDTVVIATRHNLHSQQVIAALAAEKNVFVEKPLALSYQEIDDIETSYRRSGKLLMVGYNRRFSPQIRRVKTLLNNKPMPKTFIMTMNAGYIPSDSWVHDPELGGGRIIGEACHYIDLMRFLAGSRIINHSVICMGSSGHINSTDDKVTISLGFEDGSIGSIHYFANGGKVFPKERIEVFCDDAVLKLDNFRRLKGYGWKGFSKMNLWSQDKGQDDCVKAFLDSVSSGGESPIPVEEIFEVARVSVAIAEELREK